ncbi:MAG: hypothetical protein KGZ34_06335 [Nitrosarchaeum sp.]|nr:hypothetical protein [Nitrosarchaeum sp.]
MEPNLLILTIVSMINMTIIAILIVLFAKIYVKTKAELPLGMIVVAFMLFLHNTIGALGYFMMESYYVPETFPYLLGVGIAEMIGLGIFLKISME